MRSSVHAVAALFALAFSVASPGAIHAAEAPEAFEIGAHNAAELPRGKEADGIRGDLVLRNAHVEALIAGDLPGRKANMGTDWNHPTPGALYDLSVRGSANDQLTWLAPAGMLGRVSSVRILDGADAPEGRVAVVAERTTATGDGKGQRHVWSLGPDDRHLTVVSTYTNATKEPWKLVPVARWKELSNQATVFGIQTGDAMNPPDHQGYAKLGFRGLAAPDGKAIEILDVKAEIDIAPGKSETITTWIAPGRSPAHALGVLARRAFPTGELVARLVTGAGGDTKTPLPGAILKVRVDEKTELLGYADESGLVRIALPPGAHELVAYELGREAITRTVEIEAGQVVDTLFELSPAASIRFEITHDGAPVPCKVQFVGVASTPTPKLGTDINAHGCRNQYHSESGRFRQALPAGKYRVIVTHGIEFDHVVREVTLEAGQEHLLRAELRRIVDTRGWISADFHNHSTPSGDNYCGTDDRVINLAAENIEFAPTTEHNRLYDWKPHIDRLGLADEISTVVGIELTGPNAHFNAFPFAEHDPLLQDGGAPQWQHDPRLNAIVLRSFQSHRSDRWVQLNHPQVGQFFRDRDKDGVPDGGYAGLDRLIDAAETWSLEILRAEPWYESHGKRRENRTFAWLQLLNQGVRMGCVAVADAHSVVGNGVGGWRTYVKSSVDRPADIDSREIVRNAQAGRMYVTNGPILGVQLDDGTGIGGSTAARGRVFLDVNVQTNDWVDINRVQVLVNGRQPAALNFTRASHPSLFRNGAIRFEKRIAIDLTEDAHLIVAAVGEGLDLERGWGDTWEAKMFPCAFTNPIYIDVDGGGFQANGDTLGHALPTAKDPYPPPEPSADD